ncbi:MAG: PrsW family glutamic-type intramembrane protease [Deltaproteobacteria bacterium]|nr:PrsW family glutamic-type intramembrane protease [Deltaproteobacteria bacterium]
MSLLFIILVASAPSMGLMTYFYWRDRYEREPLHHVVAAYLLGMYSMIAAQGIAFWAADVVPQLWLEPRTEFTRLFDAFVLSGSVEEISKFVVLAAAVYHWDEFDERLDGLVYGVAIALGFATLENFIYLQKYGLAIAWQRAVFAVPAHALFGGTMGYYLGKVKFPKPGRPLIPWINRGLALGLPVLFHGLYNYALGHRLDWKIWAAVVLLSVGFWLFVLRRVYRAQRASPYRPRTIAPFVHSDPGRKR